MKRIHIVGVSPRTGTTLMAEAMKTCFKIDFYSTHEDRLFTRVKGKGKANSIYLSKAPRDIMVVGPSLRVDPNLYVIGMLRDPRDIICSRHKKDPEHYWASLRYWKAYAKEFDKLISHPQFLQVRYENFVSNPDVVQTRIAERIPFLEKKIAFSKYHTVSQVSDSSKKALGSVRPIKPTSVGKWRNHKARVVGQLELHGSLANDLIKYGYEENDDWLKEIQDIEPDFNPSHFPEYMSFKKRRLLTIGKYLEAFRRMIELRIGSRIRVTHPKKWVT